MPALRKAKPDAFIGIDPGVHGGICHIYSGTGQPFPKPMLKTERDIWEYLRPFSGSIAVIEKVHAMPGNAAKAMFTFGENYGHLKMALTAADIRIVEIVLPSRWQKELGIVRRKKNESKSQWKNRLKAKAQQLFPSLKITLDTSDAILICEYCRRVYGR